MSENVINNTLEKLIGLFIYALFIVPFLIPYSYFPVSKFYAEMTALGFALVIAVLGVCKAPRTGISSAGIASFAFAIFLLLQVMVIPIRMPGINLSIAIEMVIAGLLSVGITSFIAGDEATQERLIKQIAWAVLISVTIQAIYGFLQYTGQAANFRSYILFNGSGNESIFGNIGQKNDYADFISIGIFALAYLYFIGQINLLIFLAYAVFFGFIITVNTSRTSFLYFILAIISTLSFTWMNRTHPEHSTRVKQVILLIIGMTVGLIVMEAVIPKLSLIFSSVHSSGSSGLYRLEDVVGQGSTVHRRIYEWYKDIIIFINHPIFGIGWYQFPHEGIYLMNTERFMYIPQNAALYTHSHNSPLNILAETGLVGFFITMVYGLGYSLYHMFKSFNNYATLFASFMLLTIFGQGCFQYPLWYAYFLIFFVLFLSLDKPIYQIKNSKTFKGFAVIIFLLFMGFFYVSYQTYNQLISYTVIPQDTDDFTNNVQQLEQIIDNNVIWSFPALSVLDNYMLPTSPKTNAAMSLQDQVRYIDKLGNELPYPGAIFKQIIIHREVGDNAGAMAYATLLAHAYPHFKDQFAAQLQNSPAFNNEVSAIYNFKYEERSIFTHNKAGNQ